MEDFWSQVFVELLVLQHLDVHGFAAVVVGTFVE